MGILAVVELFLLLNLICEKEEKKCMNLEEIRRVVVLYMSIQRRQYLAWVRPARARSFTRPLGE